MPAIRTSHWNKPIPIRQFDWEAVLDSYEPGSPIGFGRTEQEAIEDLRQQIAEADGGADWNEYCDARQADDEARWFNSTAPGA